MLPYISGLALYKLMDYLTRMNRRKNMARSGLKQIGEHMHVVTRTMSAEPSGKYYNNRAPENLYIILSYINMNTY